jgi:hypothetical protein
MSNSLRLNLRRNRGPTWTCIRCAHTSDVIDSHCYTCGKAREPYDFTSNGDVKPGYWSCASCYHVNSGAKSHCNICNRQRQLDDFVHYNRTRGDWQCNNCSLLVWGHQSHCGNCGYQRQLLANQWSCSSCSMVNTSNEDACLSCGKLHTNDDTLGNPNDWVCHTCHFQNFGKQHIACNRCASDRPKPIIGIAMHPISSGAAITIEQLQTIVGDNGTVTSVNTLFSDIHQCNTLRWQMTVTSLDAAYAMISSLQQSPPPSLSSLVSLSHTNEQHQQQPSFMLSLDELTEHQVKQMMHKRSVIDEEHKAKLANAAKL